ncbi:MAG: GNAT family N-acetyltransferase [Acidiferrobacterales bacterium]
MNIITVTAGREIGRGFAVRAQLHTQPAEDPFIRQVRLPLRQGRRLACLENSSGMAGPAGFRFRDTLSEGKIMHVDDLVTAEDQRSRGCGSPLFNWPVKHAATQDCAGLHLDSGVRRFAAYRFYCARQMHNSAHHFSLGLDEHS